jgi:hypothetical protein
VGGSKQTNIVMKAIVKLIMVFSVAINPVALLADGLQATNVNALFQVVTSQRAEDASRNSARHADWASIDHKTPCCDDGICILQNFHGCTLHHHPVTIANDIAFYSLALPRQQAFSPYMLTGNHEAQPDTPPPKYS